MVEAMFNAASRPSGFGLRENTLVAELEELAAQKTGKEDSLFVPTCMMANQIAIALRCNSGEIFVTERESHVMTSEMNAATRLTGAVPMEISAKNGVFELDELRQRLISLGQSKNSLKMILIENSHVRSGGRVIPVEHMKILGELAQQHGVPIHLDGARVFNAASSIGCEVTEITCLAETVAFNLNKGLGAPLGAILAGPRSLIEQAVELRQLFGGGWRPAGIPAAAGIVALNTMVVRLDADKKNAQRLAMGISKLEGIVANKDNTETNIVLARPIIMSPEKLTDLLANQGIFVLPFGRNVRFVTHHEIDTDAVDRTLSLLQNILHGGKK
tara:strand:+ start:1160 stop:2149 length:990 start_codon:yes stop_codon:yes gene_type:complete